MDPPSGLVYQSELPFERDAVQCCDGRWKYVRLRRAPIDVVAESDKKEDVWRMARVLADRPVWEEHYEKMVMVDCVPPKGVFRHPKTCFLVTDGTKMSDTTRPSKPPTEPESHVRLRVQESEPPPTPKSASWPEEQPTDWKRKIKKLVGKL